MIKAWESKHPNPKSFESQNAKCYKDVVKHFFFFFLRPKSAENGRTRSQEWKNKLKKMKNPCHVPTNNPRVWGSGPCLGGRSPIQTPISSSSSMRKIPNFLLHYLAFTYISVDEGIIIRGCLRQWDTRTMCHALHLTYKVSAFACTTYVVCTTATPCPQNLP